MNSRGICPAAISTACSSDGALLLSRRRAAERDVRAAATRGVGSSAPCRHVASPRWLAPFPSRAVGVGSSEIVVRRSAPPSPCAPVPLLSLAVGVGGSRASRPRLRACPFAVDGSVVGVGSNEEHAGSAVGCAGVGRSYNDPFRIEPERGKVTEDDVESQGNVPCDILQHDELRS